jgi:FkbM family methyltransferase
MGQAPVFYTISTHRFYGYKFNLYLHRPTKLKEARLKIPLYARESRFEKQYLTREWRKRQALKILKECAVEFSDRPRMAIFAHDHIGAQINLFGLYEKGDIEFLLSFLKHQYPDFLEKPAIDVGANIGNHTVEFSHNFTKVYSFEPEDLNFALLSVNTKSLKNVEIFKVALSDKIGRGTLQLTPGNFGSTRLSDPNLQSNSHPSCILKKLDDFSDAISAFGFLKIDVEGHEAAVLRGGQKAILENMPIIAFEQLRGEIKNGSSETIEILRRLGYKNFIKFERTISIFGIKVRRTGFFARWFGKICKVREVANEIKSFKQTNYNFLLAVPPPCEKLNKV